ncbi:hypothetical protein KAR91_83140 [Candidatus Pacearchaeota archaeon]|nr:hypothetical protein [Candidatus Pacearchaeota archaeon]
MKRKILFTLALLLCCYSLAYPQSSDIKMRFTGVKKNLQTLKQKITNLENTLQKASTELLNSNTKITSLEKQLVESGNTTGKLFDSLTKAYQKQQELANSLKALRKQLSKLKQQYTLLIIISVVGGIIIGGVVGYFIK